MFLRKHESECAAPGLAETESNCKWLRQSIRTQITSTTARQELTQGSAQYETHPCFRFSKGRLSQLRGPADLRPGIPVLAQVCPIPRHAGYDASLTLPRLWMCASNHRTLARSARERTESTAWRGEGWAPGDATSVHVAQEGKDSGLRYSAVQEKRQKLQERTGCMRERGVEGVSNTSCSTQNFKTTLRDDDMHMRLRGSCGLFIH